MENTENKPKISRQREKQKRNQAKGLCAFCSELSTNNGMCEKHHEQHTLYRRRRYAQLKALGFCPQCRGIASPGRIVCKTCSARMYQKQRMKNLEGRFPEEMLQGKI